MTKTITITAKVVKMATQKWQLSTWPTEIQSAVGSTAFRRANGGRVASFIFPWHFTLFPVPLIWAFLMLKFLSFSTHFPPCNDPHTVLDHYKLLHKAINANDKSSFKIFIVTKSVVDSNLKSNLTCIFVQLKIVWEIFLFLLSVTLALCA